jgi:hypothetical protein
MSRRLFDPLGSMMTLARVTNNREKKEITFKATMVAICDSY